MKCTGRRVLAYFVDMIFVVIVSSMFARLDILNPNIEEYKKAYEAYSEKYDTYLKERTEVSNETSTEVSSEIPNDKNYTVTLEELNDLSYDVEINSLSSKMISIVCLILYFVVFQYFTKGQTLGKLLVGIKLVDDKSNKLNIWQVIINAFIIDSILISSIMLILLSLLSKENYIRYGIYINYIDTLIILVSLIVMSFRKDGKGIHDLIANTNVISTKNKEEVKEATIVEKKEELNEPKISKKKKGSKKDGNRDRK